MHTITIKDTLNQTTIKKLDTLREQYATKDKLLLKKQILFLLSIPRSYINLSHIRTEVYGKDYADEIFEIRQMSKSMLHKKAQELKFVEGYKNTNYFKSKNLTQQEWSYMKIHDYVNNRLVSTIV